MRLVPQPIHLELQQCRDSHRHRRQQWHTRRLRPAVQLTPTPHSLHHHRWRRRPDYLPEAARRDYRRLR